MENVNFVFGLDWTFCLRSDKICTTMKFIRRRENRLNENTMNRSNENVRKKGENRTKLMQVQKTIETAK